MAREFGNQLFGPSSAKASSPRRLPRPAKDQLLGITVTARKVAAEKVSSVFSKVSKLTVRNCRSHKANRAVSGRISISDVVSSELKKKPTQPLALGFPKRLVLLPGSISRSRKHGRSLVQVWLSGCFSEKVFRIPSQFRIRS